MYIYYTFGGSKMLPQNNKPIGVISEINVYIVQYCYAIFQRDRFPGLNELFLHSYWISI